MKGLFSEFFIGNCRFRWLGVDVSVGSEEIESVGDFEFVTRKGSSGSLSWFS
jgi:hypothetical protein